MIMRQLGMSLLVVATLAGCVQTFPGGAIETRTQASAIADRSCHELDPAPGKRWAAKLEGGTWQLWKRHGGVIVSTSVDAKTGNFSDPTITCVLTPDDG
jgi:hypothetical protein